MRAPFAIDAYELGFATGVREDYDLQAGDLPNADVPCIILDNDFRDPDLDRYLEKFEDYDPSVAVLGDVYTEAEAAELDRIASGLKDEHPFKELIVVPKCESAFDVISSEVTLGVPNGYSDIQAEDLGWNRYRGRRCHVLGGSPPKAYSAIENLTQPTLNGDPPADIKGWDWNGPHFGALKGEYWSRDGWKPADSLSIRDTVRKSLEEVKAFWQDKGVWPHTEPIDLYGPAVEEPDELIFMDRGGDPIPGREGLESAYVEEYEEYGKLAFESELQKKHWEYYEGLTPV